MNELTAITDHERRRLVHQALLTPRGRYSADRASQLSGIPISTVYDWQRHDIYTPDYRKAKPMAWSYRDLIYLRLLAWLRHNRVPRDVAAKEVKDIKHSMIAGGKVDVIRTDGKSILINDELTNRASGQDPFQNVSITALMNTFNLLEPIAELGHRPLWGPDLVTPSDCTYISPWVMGGEPCVDETRIPTATIHALHTERALTPMRITKLYPGLSLTSVEDAIQLEHRLRRVAA